VSCDSSLTFGTAGQTDKLVFGPVRFLANT